MTTGILWFTTDLRLHDNEALTTALKNKEQIVPVYCLDKEQLQRKQFGFRRMGARRLQFLLETLLDLDAQLRVLGSGLVILYGKPEEVLPKFVSSYQARTVYAKKEIVPEEKVVQARVEKALWGGKRRFGSFQHQHHVPSTGSSIRGEPHSGSFYQFPQKSRKGVRCAAGV